MKISNRPFTSIAIIALLNALFFEYLLEATNLFLAVRLCVAAWAGWLVTKTSYKLHLWRSTVAGAWVIMIDHLFLTSSVIAIQFFLDSLPFNNNQISLALLGVLVSFLMFAPIAAAFGFAGGVFAKHRASYVA